MKIPEFTADASLGAINVQRRGFNQESQFPKDAVIPQFLGRSMQFQRCALICLPYPGGAGVDCFYLCHPEAALTTYPTEGMH